MVSYEVSIGFVLIPVVLWAGSFNLSAIVNGQQDHIFGFINAYGLNPLLFPLAVIFLISAMAETARTPFDLTEAESELVAGYQTEYSSMSFALFWLGEYGNVLLMCGMNAVLFWGGWLPPVDWAPLYYVPGIIWFFAKIFAFFFIFSWVKATVPRYRYDQLMRLGWKIFLPISLIWVFLVSGYLMLTRDVAHAATLQESGAAFACSYVRNPRNVPDPRRHADLRMVRHGVGEAAQWTLAWPDRPVITATSFPVEFGSVGGSQGLRWQENGASKTAYISFSDVVMEGGSTAFWMSMDRPSLWQPPGYACQSMPSSPSGADQ
jgi:hypothetical protein